MICVDVSGSMGAEMATVWAEGQQAPGSSLQQNLFSRLTEVKDVFRNLVSRISAYNLPTHLGLVTFSSSSQVRISQPLTPVLLDFQHRLDHTNPGGQTALFDAIRKGKEMLANAKSNYPGMKTRIIVLTDGGEFFHSKPAHSRSIHGSFYMPYLVQISSLFLLPNNS